MSGKKEPVGQMVAPQQPAENDVPVEALADLLAELEEWGLALLAEHERRNCDVHGPVVPSKNTGQSLVLYAERIRAAIERDNIDKSLAGETPWDEAVLRASRVAFNPEGHPTARRDPAACDYCGGSITVEDPTCCHVLGCRDCRPSPRRTCSRITAGRVVPTADADYEVEHEFVGSGGVCDLCGRWDLNGIHELGGDV